MNSSLKKEAGEFEKNSQVLISIVISSSKGTRRGGGLVYPWSSFMGMQHVSLFIQRSLYLSTWKHRFLQCPILFFQHLSTVQPAAGNKWVGQVFNSDNSMVCINSKFWQLLLFPSRLIWQILQAIGGQKRKWKLYIKYYVICHPGNGGGGERERERRKVKKERGGGGRKRDREGDLCRADI